MVRHGSWSYRARLIAVASMVFAAARAHAATGGPDAFGYRWADSDEPGIDTTVPAFTPIDLRAMGFTGDDTVIRLTLPAAAFATGFPHYGSQYASLWLSSNGWLALQDPLVSAPSSQRIPGPASPDALAAFLWGDWTLEAATAPRAVAGPSQALDAYVIALTVALKTDPTVTADVSIVLWPDGCVKLVYEGLGVPMFRTPQTEIGMESATGTIGLAYMSGGVADGGASFRSSYAVEFCPAGVPFAPLVGNTLRATKQGSIVVLRAEPTGEATEFRLYRDSAPGWPAPVLHAAGGSCTFSDDAVLGDPESRFYDVRAVDHRGDEHE